MRQSLKGGGIFILRKNILEKVGFGLASVFLLTLNSRGWRFWQRIRQSCSDSLYHVWLRISCMITDQHCLILLDHKSNSSLALLILELKRHIII
jgi:hypothetical protein